MSALVLMLLGCTDGGVPLAPADVTTDEGLYTVALSPDPEPPASGDVILGLDVSDADGAAVAGATLTLVPYMPDMGHGIMGEVEITELGDGAYEAAWAYSMPGYWELTLTVDGPAGVDEAVFGYDVR